VHPHTLRHTYASLALKATGTLDAIQQQWIAVAGGAPKLQ
jgi:site-specific recombinase XerC